MYIHVDITAGVRLSSKHCHTLNFIQMNVIIVIYLALPSSGLYATEIVLFNNNYHASQFVLVILPILPRSVQCWLARTSAQMHS